MNSRIGTQDHATGVTPDAGESPGASRMTQRVAAPLRQVTARSVFWITLINILIIAVFGVISSNHVFLGLSNARAVLLDASEIVVLSVGEAMLLGAAQLDISVGANVILSSVLGSKVMVALSGTQAQVSSGYYPHMGLGLVVGIVVCLATGMLFGLTNGVLVGWLGINALITTLGTLGIGTGVAYVLTNGLNVSYIPPPLQTDFGTKTWAQVIPAPALVAAVLCAVAWILIYKTRFGMHLLAIGSSRPAAIRGGLAVRRHIIVLFVMTGVLGGFAGLVDIARFATTDVAGHTFDALGAIAGAVIGGTSLFGGEVSIGGAIMGAGLTVLLEVGLVIMNLPAFYQQIAVGVVLLVAVAIDGRRRARRNASAR